jgi:hypothetical protein
MILLLAAVCRDRPSAMSSLEPWLFCDECNFNERDSAAAVGDRAVEPLASLLEQFPSEWRDSLVSRHARIAARAGASGSDSAAYVNLHLENFIATVQSRSAFTLGDIRTQASIAVLAEALADTANRGYRADVVRALEEAYRSATTAAFQGRIEPDTAGFLDTVWVIPTGGSLSGEESVILHSGPFPNDVLVGFSGTDSLRFVAAGLVGQYALSITNLGPNRETRWATLRVTSYPAALDTVVRDLTAGPFPQVILGSLTRTARRIWPTITDFSRVPT